MREAAFIQQNRTKWLTTEEYVNDISIVDPDILQEAYIKTTNDLSYAQTFYPNSSITNYLNDIAVSLHVKLYKNQRKEHNTLYKFFFDKIPFIAYQYRKSIYLSTIIFLLFTIIGIYSTHTDENFTRLILGDGYVNMTKENIATGDPTAVYQSGSEWGGFLGITINNIRVALVAYVYGITAGIGTLYILMENGIMLGTFQYLFYQEGVLKESMRAIWIHGSMEILAIIISGASGLILGGSILFPNTYSRIQSLKIGAKKSLQLLLSTIPFFIMAGFLEGFVTRHAHSMPFNLSWIIIFTTLSIIITYYYIYPILKFRKK